MAIRRSGILCALSFITVLSGAAFAALDAGTWHPVGGIGDGCSGTVWAETAAPNGDLYVGGAFRACGDVAADTIARWDGSQWSALGAGTDGTVFAIAVAGSDVYVAGIFSHAGDVAANNIARWDGNAWHALGAGISATPNGFATGEALAILGTDVYVGGVFDLAGATAASSVARWDSVAQTWSALGSGLSATGSTVNVNALTVFNGALIAGGIFDHAGGNAALNLASWNGSSWAVFDNGVSGNVNALAVSGATLYVAGNFSHAGAVSATRIAAWTAATGWSALGSGIGGNGITQDILAMAPGSDGLYVGGQFTLAGGVAQNHIARWDGSNWMGVGGGVAALQSSRVVRALAAAHGKIYAGGAFNTAGTTNAHFIAAWDGATWAALDATAGSNGIASAVYSLTTYGTATCAGSFWPAAYGQGMLVCAAGGGAWSPPGGMPFYSYDGIEALASANGRLYIGYYTPNGTCCLSYWNGSAYSGVGPSGVPGMDSDVLAVLPVPGGGVYAAGDFASVGGQFTSGIAYWDGSAWQALGSGLPTDVYALALYGGKLYAGGTFVIGSGVDASSLAVWDGTTWSPFGAVDAPVYALLAQGSRLFVGGSFAHAGAVPANGIADWDGTTWHALTSAGGNGVSYNGSTGTVLTMLGMGGRVYLGGQFDNAGTVAVGNVARWDGAAFAALGANAANGIEVNGSVKALVANGADLFVGGQFGAANGQVSADIARYTPDLIFANSLE